jgi:energy-coupling factor transporter ATP-binding protein EcfA2
MITRLELKNFAAFANLEIDFSAKINVIIGENGTGKTQLLKAAYGLCLGSFVKNTNQDIGKDALEAALSNKVLRLFRPIDGKLGRIRRHATTESAQLQASFAPEGQVRATFHSNSQRLAIQEMVNYGQYSKEPVFVPTKEVLSLVQGMSHPEHDQQTVEWIFDDTYVDLAELLLRPGHEDPESTFDDSPRIASVIPALATIIGGRYHWEDRKFCFQAGKYEERSDPQHSRAAHAKFYQDSSMMRFVPSNEPAYSSSMTAEGFRKVGMLSRLLTNGALEPGLSGPLFWDEPESNLNPKLIRGLVQCLLELARNGQQIILATHDYVLLKWFDLLVDAGKEDHVRFHSIYRETDSNEVKILSTDAYSSITPNPIDDAFGQLINREIENEMGDLGR